MTTDNREKSNNTISENQAIKEATALIMNACSAVGYAEEDWVLSDAEEKLSNTTFKSVLALAVIDKRASIVIENNSEHPSTKHLSFDAAKMMELAVLEYAQLCGQTNNGIDKSYAYKVGDKVLQAVGTLKKDDAINLYQCVMRSFPYHFREQAGNAINDIIPKFSCSEEGANSLWIEAKISACGADPRDTIKAPKAAALVRLLTPSKYQPKLN